MRLSPEELREGSLGPERLELLTTSFRLAGLAVIEEAVPQGLLAEIRAGVLELLDSEHGYITQKTADGIDTRVGASFFPFRPPFTAPEVVANPILLQVVKALVGEDAVCRVYNSNLSLPGSLPQPVHVDIPSVMDDGSMRPDTCAAVHVLLTDFTTENGSTEIWPGTHLHPTRVQDAEKMARLAPELPSVRTNHPAGSIVVRDPSAWHRGNANFTEESRDMLSMFFAPRGSLWGQQTFGRPLGIDRQTLESLPEQARPIWQVNLVDV